MLSKELLAERIFEASCLQLKKRFEGFSKIENIHVGRVELEQAAVNIDHRSEIFLYGIDITVRLQIFYNIESSLGYLTKATSSWDPRKCIDFYNELCNLVCGKLKEQFILQNILVAISLPIDIETSQKSLVMAKDVLSHVKCFEGLSVDGAKLFSAKASLEIHEPKNFESYYESINPDNEEGDVEFL